MHNVRIVRRPQNVDDVFVHGYAEVWRGDAWHACGVFQLLRAEWLRFATLCAQHDIEITHEQAFPADASETAAAV
jgi:hypothetical protein